MKNALRDRVMAEVVRRWPFASKDILRRIDFELSVFEACGRVEYCLMALSVADAIRKAGGRIGPGRGACASSAVLYALGITNVDPLKHGLTFEMFMLPEKKLPATIFIDTDTKGDSAARAYLEATYGAICDLPRQAYAPQLVAVNGWEIGITKLCALDFSTEILTLAKESGRDVPDLGSLPLDEDATWSILRSGNAVGIACHDMAFVCENPKGEHREFADLVAIAALSGPGLSVRRDEYLKRRSGIVREEFAHPLLLDAYGETNGLLVYQEQLMHVVRLLAGFTRNEAYECKKAIARLQMDKMNAFREKFVLGCLANPCFRIEAFADETVARETAASIWNDMARFGRYAIMKSHAVCSAMLAYQLTYLRSHYHSEWLQLVGTTGAAIGTGRRSTCGLDDLWA